MATFRVNKTKDYTIMSNYHFRDKNLSLKAKGLLSLMLSLPEDWDYSLAGLQKLNSDGKDGVNSALLELEKYKYLVRTQSKDSTGKFNGYIYDIYEKPFTENPLSENPLSENPLSGKPLQYNTINNKILNNKILNNKEELKEEKALKGCPIGGCKEETINDILFLEPVEVQDNLKEFIKMRKTIKKPLTTRAFKMIVKKLHDFSSDFEIQNKILEKSIINAWQDIYELKDVDNKNLYIKPEQALKEIDKETMIITKDLNIEKIF